MIQNEETMEPDKLVDEYIDSTIEQLKDDIHQVEFGHRELGSKGFLKDRIQFYKRVKELVEDQRKYKNVEPYVNKIETYHYSNINRILIKIWSQYEPSRKKLEGLDSRRHPSSYIGPTACLIDNYCKALKPVKYDSEFVMMHYNSSPEVQMDLLFKAIDKDFEKRANRILPEIGEEDPEYPRRIQPEYDDMINKVKNALSNKISQEEHSKVFSAQELQQFASLKTKKSKMTEAFQKKADPFIQKIDLLSHQQFQVKKMLDEIQENKIEVDENVRICLKTIRGLLGRRLDKAKKKYEKLNDKFQTQVLSDGLIQKLQEVLPEEKEEQIDTNEMTKEEQHQDENDTK